MKETEKLDILKKLVSIDTQDKDESKIADYLEELFIKYNIFSEKIQVIPGRENLVAYLGKGEKTLGLTGHMDVVSVGDRSKWLENPFIMHEVEGRLYGRGASDMKSGLSALVIAMIELKEAGVQLNGRVKLLATVDEEKNELGAEKLTEMGYISDLDALIVAEPSGFDNSRIPSFFYSESDAKQLLKNNNTREQHFLIYSHNGSYDYKVTSRGKSVHSSLPELGVNAIDNLMLFYNKQQEYFNNNTLEDDVLGQIIPVNTLISGGEQINTVPGEASLTGRIRTTPTHTGQQITNDLNNIINVLNKENGTFLELEVLNDKFPIKSNPNSDFIQLVKKLGSKYLDQDYPLKEVAGGTDAGTFIKGNPNLQVAVIGPGNDSSHMENEYVDKEIYLKCIEFYKAIIVEFLK